MTPKHKSQASIKQDQPRKQNQFLKDKNADTDDKDGQGSKKKEGEQFNFSIKQEKNDSFSKRNINQEHSETDQKCNSMEYASLELNQLLQQKSKMNFYEKVCWKTFVFPKISQIGSFPSTSLTYFGLDLVDEETERTVWTHKASV